MIRNVKHTNLNSKSVVNGFKSIFNDRVEDKKNLYLKGQSKHDKK